ncbi:unnamed protein product [Victoria cruziana]
MSGSSGGGGGGGGGGGPCGACKFLRRKCVNACIFAPYFDSEQGAAHFAAVHKVFGASNVSKLLLHIPPHKRLDAVVTICYEAQARLRDPVYGCVAHIFALQQQVVNLQAELAYMQAHLSTLELTHQAPLPSLQAPAVPELPTTSNIANFDMSTIFEPAWSQAQQQQQQQLHQHQQQQVEFALRNGRNQSEQAAGGELQALARELLNRHRASAPIGSSAKALSN